MSRKKRPKKSQKLKVQEGAATTNRYGCGCVIFSLIGLVIAMMAAALMQ